MPKESQELMKQGESIPQICLDVHMSLCGSTDPLDTETMQRYGDVLRLARDHWEPAAPAIGEI